MKHGKKYVEGSKLIENGKFYDTDEAVEIAVKTGTAKFDETVEIHVRLGVDSRHADQQVRGAVVLPMQLRRQEPIMSVLKSLLQRFRTKTGLILMLLSQHPI